MSNLQQQRMVVEQLRREANIKRISVSQAVEDIKVGWLVTMKMMLIALFRSLCWRASVQTASCWASPAREGTRTGRSPGLARLSRTPGNMPGITALKTAFLPAFKTTQTHSRKSYLVTFLIFSISKLDYSKSVFLL